MARPPDKSETGKSETDKPESGKWTDGGPTPGGPQDKSFAYRQSRKAFITACEKAGADVVGRVHHARAPDGGPLFLDAAAFGPRLAPAGVLVAGYGAPGAGVLLALLADRIAQRLPLGTRLVLVHGADPAVFATNDPAKADPAWVARMLTAVVTEDLSRAGRVTVLGLGGAADFEPPPGMAVTRRTLAPGGAAKAAVEAVLAGTGRG